MAETEGSTKKKRRFSWRFVIIVIVVAVLALGAGFGARWWQQRNNDTPPVDGDLVQQSSEAERLMYMGDYDQATKIIDQALQNSQLTSDEKYAFLLQKGVTFENQKDYAKALDSYRQAAAVKETSTVAEGIARTAEATGATQLAIDSYKKAIQLVPPDEPFRDEIITYLQAAITRLGGQP